MSFNAVYNHIIGRRGAGAGLKGVRELLGRLGNPQNDYKIIHVAGTNGKGSVCMLTARTLQCAGYKTGLFLSPHLTDPRERVQLNGEPVSKAAFTQTIQDVLRQEEGELNFFEILTAAALLYFSRQKAQYVVLETGLGGRKDPTNVCMPAACVITSVGRDHMHLLGNSLAQIAREKAGIIKPGVPVFSGADNPTVREELLKAAKKVSAPLTFAAEGQPFFEYAFDFVNNQTVLHTCDGREWLLSILGPRQTANACLVYQLARYLQLPETALQRAFGSVCIPARFEVLRTPGTVFILDGAHNAPAVENLVSFFNKSPYCGQAALWCGFMKDKEYKKMLALLCPHFKDILVTVPSPERGADETEIRAALPKGARIRFFKTPARALSAARKYQTVLCTGSFYLAGWARGKIC